MVIATEVFLCRTDDNHWCVECCRGRECCVLGELGDGTMGCRGHNGKRFDGLTETSFCRNFNCLTREEDPEELRMIISLLPEGEFRMDDILKIYRQKSKFVAVA
jgi:hypothetical protein